MPGGIHDIHIENGRSAVTTQGKPAIPRMRGDWRPEHRIRAYAARMRVFTVADVMRDMNVAAAHGIDTVLAKGDIVRHADGVFALHGVPAGDPRITAAAARVGKQAADAATIEKQMAKCEEREARRLEDSLPQESPTRRIDAFLRKNPVFLKQTAIAAGLGRTDEVLKTLIAEERVRSVDGLYLRGDVELNDARVDAFLEKHSEEGAAIVADMASALKVAVDADAIRYREEKRSHVDGAGVAHPRPTRLHVLVPGCPPIYGIERGRNRTAGIDWHGVNANEVSRITAETIARKAICPMPRTLAELRRLAAAGAAPVAMTRRNTGLPVVATGEIPCNAPDARKVPVPGRTIVTVDTSEDDAVLAALTGVHDLHVVRARLADGDYRIRHARGDITIERKTVSDLAASFDDGRLTRQIPRLAAIGHRSFLLVEGDMHGTNAVAPSRLLRLQTRLAGLGIGFLTSRDPAGSAYVIATLVRDVLAMTGRTAATLTAAA